MDYKKVIMGMLVFLIASTVVYVTFNRQVKIRVGMDDTSFLLFNEETHRWNLAAKETVKLFDGARLMNRNLGDIHITTEFGFDNSSGKNFSIVTRDTGYIRGPRLVHQYYFVGDEITVEQVPMFETIRVLDAKGKLLRYEAQIIGYDGPAMELTGTDFQWGKMRVQWNLNYNWARIYKNGKIKVQYRVESDDQTFSFIIHDPLPSPDGWYAHYRADGNGNDDVQGLTCTISGATSATNCPFGTCYYFNGNQQSFGRAAYTWPGTGEFVVYAWINVTDDANEKAIGPSVEYGNAGEGPEWGIYLDGAEHFEIRINDHSTVWDLDTAPYIVPEREWHFVLAQRNSTGHVQLWVDGELKNVSVNTNSATSTNAVYWGRDFHYAVNYDWYGHLDNFGYVRGTSFTAEEIVAMNASQTGILWEQTVSTSVTGDSNNNTYTNFTGSITFSPQSPYYSNMTWYNSSNHTGTLIFGVGYDNSNAMQYDFSGNDHNMSCVNCPTFESGAGKYGGAMHFDGTNDLYNSTPMNLSMFSNGTIMAWFKVDDTKPANDQSLFGFGNTIYTPDTTALVYDKDGIAKAYIYKNCSGSCTQGDYLESTRKVNDSNWHLLALVSSGTSVTMYVDGEAQGDTLSGQYGNVWWDDFNYTENPTVFAAWTDGGRDYFDGYVDDIRLLSYPVSAAEMLRYNASGPWTLDHSRTYGGDTWTFVASTFDGFDPTLTTTDFTVDYLDPVLQLESTTTDKIYEIGSTLTLTITGDNPSTCIDIEDPEYGADYICADLSGGDGTSYTAYKQINFLTHQTFNDSTTSKAITSANPGYLRINDYHEHDGLRFDMDATNSYNTTVDLCSDGVPELVYPGNMTGGSISQYDFSDNEVNVTFDGLNSREFKYVAIPAKDASSYRVEFNITPFKYKFTYLEDFDDDEFLDSTDETTGSWDTTNQVAKMQYNHVNNYTDYGLSGDDFYYNWDRNTSYMQDYSNDTYSDFYARYGLGYSTSCIYCINKRDDIPCYNTITNSAFNKYRYKTMYHYNVSPGTYPLKYFLQAGCGTTVEYATTALQIYNFNTSAWTTLDSVTASGGGAQTANPKTASYAINDAYIDEDNNDEVRLRFMCMIHHDSGYYCFTCSAYMYDGAQFGRPYNTYMTGEDDLQVVTSQTIFNPLDNIYNVTLNVSAVNSSSQVTDFEISADGGTNWEQVNHLNEEILFNFTNPGTDLRWRAKFWTDNQYSSPNITLISMPEPLETTFPSNFTIDVANDGVLDYNNVTSCPGVISVDLTSNASTAISEYVQDYCSEDDDYCLLPIYMTSGSRGVADFTWINITAENIENVNISVDCMENACNSTSCDIPINVTGGPVTLDNLALKFKGEKNITFRAHHTDYLVNSTLQGNFYFSNYNYTIAGGLNKVIFQFKTAEDEERWPYGQTATNPIFRVNATTGYDDRNVIISLKKSETTDCAYIKGNNNSAFTGQPSQFLSTSRKDICNITQFGNCGIWLYTTLYGCSGGEYLNPTFYLDSRCDGCYITTDLQ